MKTDLFEDPPFVFLAGHAGPVASDCLSAITSIARAAPFRRMSTPGGRAMSVAMTNCGSLGWITDRRGYRYVADDPLTGHEWPAMPATFRILAAEAARLAGYPAFEPDACLINRYEPGARMALHQDRDEGDLAHPIVSVSLGLPAMFLWGGVERTGTPRRISLAHGDVLVWGGAHRLAYHGVASLADGRHEATGATRYNLTFRRAG